MNEFFIKLVHFRLKRGLNHGLVNEFKQHIPRLVNIDLENF